MNREPVIVGQVAAVAATLGMFWAPVREALEAVGGATGFAAAVGTVITFVTMLIRSRVSPVA